MKNTDILNSLVRLNINDKYSWDRKCFLGVETASGSQQPASF